jgi:Na+/H+ antiporter NhaA
MSGSREADEMMELQFRQTTLPVVAALGGMILIIRIR